MKTRAARTGARNAGRRMKRRRSGLPTDKAARRHHRGFGTSPDIFRLALDNLTEYALITTDLDLLISDWSGQAEAMFGYTEDEIRGQSIKRIFTAEDIAAGYDTLEFKEALRKGKKTDERWHACKDGRLLWCYGIAFPLLDDKGVARGFVKLVRNDTERKRTNDLLRESEERLRLAAESTGLGTWDYDVESKSLQLSKRAGDLFGLEAGTRADGFALLLPNVDPEDRDRIFQDFHRALAKGETAEGAFDMEYRVRPPGRALRWVRTAAKLFRRGGACARERVIGTVVDITEVHQSKLAERELNQELERRVKDRTAQLDFANKELETFAYSASHDLRAPLRKISGFCQAILQGAESRLSPEDRDYFGRIRTATGQMHRLIDDLLNLTKIARKPLVRETCDLSAVAERIADGLRQSAPGREVEFVVAPGIRVEGDPELLKIALGNLLENSWKFTSRRARSRIEFGAARNDGRPVFFVKDDGAGFDMQYAHKLFSAFTRLHPEEEFPGTGVGLGIVERIVRRHHGRIWAEAKVDEGAIFYFTLDTEEA